MTVSFSPYQCLIGKEQSDVCETTTTAQQSGSEDKNEQMGMENVQPKTAGRNMHIKLLSKSAPKVRSLL